MKEQAILIKKKSPLFNFYRKFLRESDFKLEKLKNGEGFIHDLR